MTPAAHSAELLEVLEALCRDEISAEQLRRLEQLVCGNEELRRTYVRYLHMHICLREAFGHVPEESAEAVAARATAAPPRKQPSTGRRRWPGFRTLLAASLLLAIGGAIWLVLSRFAVRSVDPIAKITRAVGSAWDGLPMPEINKPLGPQHLALTAGMAELTFRSGAVVLLEGPADLELVNPARAFLHSGRLVARVADKAQGFVVETPSVRVLDQGTEFGVGVDARGDTLVQVFDGAVVANYELASGGAATPQCLWAGQAVYVENGGAARPQPASFASERFIRTFPEGLQDSHGRVVSQHPLTPANRDCRSEVHVVPAPRPPTIDGQLSDWDLSGGFKSACADPYGGHYYVEGWMMYDSRNLYIAAHVGDPAPMRNVIDPVIDPLIAWRGGAVQVRLSTDRSLGWPLEGEATWLRRLPPRPQDVSRNLVHLTMWYCRPKQLPCLSLEYGVAVAGTEVVNPPTSRGAFRADDDGRGYVAEYAIPWTLLHTEGQAPRPGDVLGCCWNVHWSDEGGRVWKGYLVDVLNPAALPGLPDEYTRTYARAATWGKAIYEPVAKKQGKP